MSFREFDAEKHDREELCLYRDYICPEFLKAHDKWQSINRQVLDADDIFKSRDRHFRPYMISWVELQDKAIKIADQMHEAPKLLRQVTHSDQVGVNSPESAIPMPVEPETPAEWKMVCASWQPTVMLYGEQHGRWVWFWEGMQK